MNILELTELFPYVLSTFNWKLQLSCITCIVSDHNY